MKNFQYKYFKKLIANLITGCYGIIAIIGNRINQKDKIMCKVSE